MTKINTGIRVVCMILCCVAHSLHMCAQDVVMEKIVAKVGNELLLKSEIEQSISFHESRSRNSLSPETVCAIIDDQLTTKLLIAQAAEDSIVVAESQIEGLLQQKIDYILSLMDNDVELFRTTYGKSVQEVRNAFREDLKKQETAKRMRQEVMSSIRITPSQVLDYFKSIPEDSLPYFNSEVEVGEIIYYPEPNEEERSKSRQYLTEIKELILEGTATFEDLARKYSDDPGSARLGGRLGWQKRGTFVPEFEAAAYNLEEGEMSDIVESEFGYHLIRLEKRRGNSILASHILIDPEIKDKDIGRAKLKLDSIADLLRYDSLPFEVAVKKYSDENIQSYNNGGRMINPNTGKTFFETQELDPDIFFAIDSIEVGEITEPILFRDPRGKYYYRIIKLFSRTPPHQADITQDYSRVKEAALSKYQEEHIRKWVNETIKDTYIELDEQYFEQYDCSGLQKWRGKS